MYTFLFLPGIHFAIMVAIFQHFFAISFTDIQSIIGSLTDI